MAAHATASFCLICDASCSSSQNSVQIFNKDNFIPTEINVLTVLEQLLDKEINESSVHSQILCKNCFKLVDEYDELQSRVCEIKKEMAENYHNTLQRKENPQDTDDLEATLVKESTKDIRGGKIKESGIIRSKELSRKILDIPSSDDESTQVTQKPLQTLEDIEMALVKIHGESDEKHDMDIETSKQSFDPFANSDSEESSVDIRENKIKYKIQPRSKEDSTSSAQSSSMLSGNIISQQPVDKLKNTDEESNAPIVTRDGALYTCLLCTGAEVVGGQAKTIIEHVKGVHQSRLYICDICGLDFRKRNLLSSHMDEHVSNEKGDFQCKACNMVFTNLRLFSIHKRIHLPRAKAWICSTCGKRCNSKNLLAEHVNTHLGLRPYVCVICGKDFASKYILKTHERTHDSRSGNFNMHLPQGKAWICPTCGKRCNSKNLLDEHVNTHLGIRPYVCRICGKDFASKYTVKAHEKTHLSRPRPFKCVECGKSYLSQQNLAQHERTHTDVREFQCHFCNRQFESAHNLEVHLIVHTDYKPYICSQDDGEGFKGRRLPDYRIKAGHTGDGPFKCETCKATFVYPKHLMEHRRIHTGEKLYICEVCGMAFNSRDNRDAHRFVHSDKKPYECMVCGAGFLTKPLLYQHMKAEGHLNDTIVVNQPRLILENGTEHIIIDGQKLTFAEQSSDYDDEEIIDEIEQVISTEDGDYEEILSSEAMSSSETQIDTPDGPVKVRIPNEDEEALIKIVPA